jgi:hypothetical protein
MSKKRLEAMSMQISIHFVSSSKTQFHGILSGLAMRFCNQILYQVAAVYVQPTARLAHPILE